MKSFLVAVANRVFAVLVGHNIDLVISVRLKSNGMEYLSLYYSLLIATSVTGSPTVIAGPTLGVYATPTNLANVWVDVYLVIGVPIFKLEQMITTKLDVADIIFEAFIAVFIDKLFELGMNPAAILPNSITSFACFSQLYTIGIARANFKTLPPPVWLVLFIKLLDV